MLIRSYQPSDLPQVLYLHRVAMEEVGAYKGDGPWDDDLKDIITHYQEGAFLVMEQEDKIMAMGAFKPSEENLAEVKRMRVLPSAQGAGLGKKIYFELEKKAIELGYKGFHLETSELQTSAQQLYQKVGFNEYNRMVIDGYNCVLFKKIF